MPIAKPNLNFEQYLKAKESLTKENYNLIEEHNFVKNWTLTVIKFVGLVWVFVSCGVWMGQGACVALDQSFLKLGFDSPTSYVEFVRVTFVLESQAIIVSSFY